MQHASEHRTIALRLVPMFADLSESQLQLLADHADERGVGAGNVLVREGDEGDSFMLLLNGSARVERGGQLLAQLNSNQFFGEMALLDGKPRAATVTMEVPGEVLIINRDTFRSLLDTVPEFRDRVLVVLCERLRGLQTPMQSAERRPAPHPVELDHLYAFGEVYDAIDVCDQVTQALNRLKRHGVLSADDVQGSEQHLDAVRRQLEARLGQPTGAA